jgi:prepilin-type N-terminal cleavage/methylation domain-containing protein
MLRQPSTHARLHHGELERDISDRHHGKRMIGDRVRVRLGEERGFTLVEILIVIILVGLLAAIALAVFLRQEDKARDSSAKSDVTNVVHQVQSCNAGRQDGEDFRDCDTPGELGQTGIEISGDAPNEVASGDCTRAAPGDSVSGGTVRVLQAGADCFVVLGVSKSGNRFWYVKHNGGGFSRDCTTHGVNGCPPDGQWAG